MKIPKSYRYYKTVDLESVCGISNQMSKEMLAPVKEIAPSDLLRKTLARNMMLPMKNEKAKSEFLVAPILAEVWDINQNFKPFSGHTFNVDPAKGLNGVCDFLVSSNPLGADLDKPVVCVYEAKNDSIDDWYGQCGAEMYAARIFNRQAGSGIELIHGAVTNGFIWQFLKLEGEVLYIDSQRYAVANLPQLLGALQKVYDVYIK